MCYANGWSVNISWLSASLRFKFSTDQISIFRKSYNFWPRRYFNFVILNFKISTVNTLAKWYVVRIEQAVQCWRVRATHKRLPLLKCYYVVVFFALNSIIIKPVCNHNQTQIPCLYIIPYLQNFLLRKIVLNVKHNQNLIITWFYAGIWLT